MNLSLKNLVGLCTDGATSMTGEIKGLCGLIHKENRFMIYVWCVCHRFDLCVKHSIKQHADVHELLQHIHDLSVFIHGSSKRLSEWIRTVKLLSKEFKEINSRVRPARINVTRWSSGHDALNSVFKSPCHFLAMYLTLHNILHTKPKSVYNLSTENLALLRRLYKYWSIPGNISFGFILHAIFIQLHKHSTNLQTSCLPIIEMVPTIKTCFKYIQDLCEKSSGISVLSNLYLESETFLIQLNHIINEDSVQNIIIENKREVALLSNVQSSVNRKIPNKQNQYLNDFLNTLVKHFQNRFIDEFTDVDSYSKDFYDEIASLCPNKVMQYNSNTRLSLRFISKIFKLDEFALLSEIKSMGPDLKTYHQKCCFLQEHSLNGLLQNLDVSSDSNINEYDTVLVIDDDVEMEQSIRIEWQNLRAFLSINSQKAKYKTVFKLYQILLSLPCTQTKCERDFSVFKSTKTSNRSQLNDNNLESIMVIKMSADMLPISTIPTIIERIALISAQLKNILNDV